MLSVFICICFIKHFTTLNEFRENVVQKYFSDSNCYNCNIDVGVTKVPNTVDVPGFVAYPYLEDPFDYVLNLDIYLLMTVLSIYNHPLLNYYNYKPPGFYFVYTIDSCLHSSKEHFSHYHRAYQNSYPTFFLNLSIQITNNLIDLFSIQRDSISKDLGYEIHLIRENKKIDLGCAIECFLKRSIRSLLRESCSQHKSLVKDRVNSQGRIAPTDTESMVLPNVKTYVEHKKWTLLSHVNIIEVRFISSYTYEKIYIAEEYLDIFKIAGRCCCFLCFKQKLRQRKIRFSEKSISYEKGSNPHQRFYEKSMLDNRGNHLCLCLIIKYRLSPVFKICLCYFGDISGDLHGLISRGFYKYTNLLSTYTHLSKLILFMIDIMERITLTMKKRYLCVCDPSTCVSRGTSSCGGCKICTSGICCPGVSPDCKEKVIKMDCKNKGERSICSCVCFCKSHEDPYYIYFVSVIIYVFVAVEALFHSDSDRITWYVRFLSRIIDELSSIGHTTQHKCPPAEQVGESQSTSSQQTESNRCPSVQTPNNIILMELYKSLASIFSQNLRLLKFGGVYFLLGLEFFVDQLSNVGSILNPIISYNSNYWIVSYLESVRDTIEIKLKNREGLLSFYQFFSMLSFSLINNNSLCENTKKKVKEVTVLVSSVYISIVSKKKEQKKNKCFFEKPADRTLIASCISLIYYFYNDLSLQLSNKVVLDFIVYSGECNKDKKIPYYLTRRTINYPENMSKNSRTNRIVDSTNEISNNKLEQESNNHYSYNDAYRINKSRAHGSLKYIIIKIVLILIIVVMTIFHPMCVSISRQKKLIAPY